MQLSHILCPVDFSDLSARALRYAGMLSGRLDVRVVEGLPVDAIQKTARESHADLIVMGTHGA